MKYKNGHEGSEGFVSVPTHAEPPLNIRSALSLWGLMAQLRRLIAQLLLAGAIAALLLLLDRDATTEAWRRADHLLRHGRLPANSTVHEPFVIPEKTSES